MVLTSNVTQADIDAAISDGVEGAYALSARTSGLISIQGTNTFTGPVTYGIWDYVTADNGSDVIVHADATESFQNTSPAKVDIYDGSTFLPDLNSNGFLEGWYGTAPKLQYFENGQTLSGLQELDGDIYYFGPNTYTLTGWQTIGNDTYYFSPTDAKAYTGTHTIGNYKCVFDSKGVLQSKTAISSGGSTTTTPSTPTYTEGLVESADGLKYQYSDGTYAKDEWVDIDDDTYFFDENGIAATGLWEIDDDLYYFNDEGVMQTGWQEVDDDTYFFDEDGKAVTGTVEIDGVDYEFASDGVLIGEVKDDPEPEPEPEPAPVQTGWVKNDDKTWSYKDANGNDVTGWQKLNWDDSTDWYFFDEDGIMLKGWQKLDWDGTSSWYYFQSGGSMVKGLHNLEWDGAKGTYYFNASGAMMTSQWQKVNNSWYYFGRSGAAETGWKHIGWNGSKEWYFFYQDGKMASSTTIGIYRLGSSGACLNPND